jgi:hypothetical protein
MSVVSAMHGAARGWLTCPFVDGAMGDTLMLLMIVHDHSVLNVSILSSVQVAIEGPHEPIWVAPPQGASAPVAQG